MIAPNRYLVSYIRNIIINPKLNSFFLGSVKKKNIIDPLTSDIPYYSIKKLNTSDVIDKKFSTKCL